MANKYNTINPKTDSGSFFITSFGALIICLILVTPIVLMVTDMPQNLPYATGSVVHNTIDDQSATVLRCDSGRCLVALAPGDHVFWFGAYITQ